MSDKELNIVFEDWEWECGDQCCYDSGTSMSINGTQLVKDVRYNEEEVARELLQYLGITNFSIEEKSNDQ